jgi:CHAD domain-containing protein
MARARPIDLDCDGSFAAAARRTIEVRAAELFEHSAGVLDLAEIENVHDMRVATRRLRAAMEVFAPCFPPKRFRPALKQVKKLADGLGRRRDPDVSILALEAFAAKAPGTDRELVEELISGLREEQLRANQELSGLVADERLGKLRRRLARLTASAPE